MAKILVADDEPDVRLIVSERLRRSGHDVECACDGTEAVQKSGETVYDLLILDIRMPGYTGYEVCESSKVSVKNAKTPVLLISAFPDEIERRRKSKADAFLAKPFEAAHLISAVDALLKRNG